MSNDTKTALDRSQARYNKAAKAYDKVADKSSYAAAKEMRKMRTELTLARYLRRG